MTNSCVICEGNTDSILLQYYLRKAFDWEDCPKEKATNLFRYKDNDSRKLIKSDRSVTIVETGGVSEFIEALSKTLVYQRVSIDEYFERIIIFTDHDEVDSLSRWHDKVRGLLQDANVVIVKDSENCFVCEVETDSNTPVSFELDTVIVPFDEEGALETFLLNSVSEKDPYDAEIIRKGNSFIEAVDAEKRYLNHKRIITKAKFDVYFSVRTPYKFFRERQDILKNVPWEEYISVRKEFEVFAKL